MPCPLRSAGQVAATIALGLVLLLGTNGCAVTTLDGRSLPVRSEAFSDYVEAVFRRQNEVATELVFALEAEDPDSDRYRRLDAAEDELLEACGGLNEIALRRRDGDEGGGLGALRRARQAPACDAATRRVSGLLEE